MAYTDEIAYKVDAYIRRRRKGASKRIPLGQYTELVKCEYSFLNFFYFLCVVLVLQLPLLLHILLSYILVYIVGHATFSNIEKLSPKL